MNSITLQVNKNDATQPEFSVSPNFEAQMLKLIRQGTSIDLELITADKETYYDEHNGALMIRYRLLLSEERQQEFLKFGRKFSEVAFNLIHNLN
jgi:hypothetical protein